MENDFLDLKKEWSILKEDSTIDTPQISNIQQKIKERQRQNFSFYYGTLLILSITFIGIVLFFIYIAPIQENLSLTGWYMMLIGLGFRIVAELISISKAKQIQNTLNAKENLQCIIRFHKHRKWIHNILAPFILILYTVGFYMMVPEFSRYMSDGLLIYVCASYVVVGIILFMIIRKSVKREILKIREMAKLKASILDS